MRAQLGNCIESQQFDRAMLDELFVIAEQMEKVRQTCGAALDTATTTPTPALRSITARRLRHCAHFRFSQHRPTRAVGSCLQGVRENESPHTAAFLSAAGTDAALFHVSAGKPQTDGRAHTTTTDTSTHPARLVIL